MSNTERHTEALSLDCEKYLLANGMYSIADHKDDTDPADIYTNDGQLIVLQLPRDISQYYLMRLIQHGHEQYAKALAIAKLKKSKVDSVPEIFACSSLLERVEDGITTTSHTLHWCQVKDHDAAIASAIAMANELKPSFNVKDVICGNILTNESKRISVTKNVVEAVY